ncbi:TPA: hypothetical protein QDB15_005685 [Burkholderia vietnamiensis]|uniref:toxin-antitoxin system YwqK family antitoxin n=1 Tax=Burkholderia vietnamiensis TaxID=60552 RepID=UPI000B036497|nr:hypothetical protein [Burkholderia vietnamiensis]MBR8161652.1 hypothetical protein [Burkholderia vietnamiensis]MCA7946738.1 hypothetical protein [Burkholderia vietnamiensis]MCA8211582.1 hypothetical protein [Burkholderia vietnamiensis]MDN7413058.1 hypothetical protein [Burkholderia vietnamiensis]HDR9102538.1 hypothetical protein [Burkholderia vietnamiensis]
MRKNHRSGLVVTSLIAALAVAGCSGNTLDWRNAQVSNGKIYEGDANKPFSGKVTNIPFGTIYSGQAGYQKIAGTAGSILAVLFGSSLLCDSEVDEGLPDGDTTCKLPQSDIVQVKGHFEKGVMAGSFTMYDRSGKNAVLEVNYKDGQPDGTLKRYAPDTGKLVVEQSLSVGVADGKYKEWDAKTGNLLVEQNFSHGVLDGDFVRNDADGNVLAKGSYSSGKFTGFESFRQSYNSYKGSDFVIVEGRKQYEDGAVKNGPELDAANTFASDVQHCVDHKSDEAWYTTHHRPTKDETPPLINACKQEVTSRKASADQVATAPKLSADAEDRNDWPKESNACTSAWEAAYHKANGPDSPINYSQEWEFVDNCRAGKSPQSSS